jgi:hypothetical protein
MSRIEKMEEELEYQAIEEINRMIDPQSWALCPSLNSLGWDFIHNSLIIATGDTKLMALKNAISNLRERKEEEYEIVDHPQHYGGKQARHEAISVIEEWGLGFHLGNVVKYISRAGKKPNQDTISDLKKARWYLDRYIGDLEANNVADSEE